MSHLRKMFRKQLDFTEFRPKRGTSIRNSATTYITTAQWLVVNFMRQFTANLFLCKKIESKFLKQFCSHPILSKETHALLSLAGNLNFKLRIVFWNIFFGDLEIWKTNCTFWKKATFRAPCLKQSSSKTKNSLIAPCNVHMYSN